MKKKILGIILAILMISAIIPMAAFADTDAAVSEAALTAVSELDAAKGKAVAELGLYIKGLEMSEEGSAAAFAFGRDMINAAETVADVDNALENAMMAAGFKKAAEVKAAEELAEIKDKAVTEFKLAAAELGLLDLDLVVEEIAKINAAENAEAVAAALEAAKEAAAAQRAVEVAAALEAAKEEAVAEFKDYVKKSLILNTSFVDAQIEKINAAEDTDAVAAALEAAKNVADMQKAAEVAAAKAKELKDGKDAAIKELKAYASEKGIKDTYALEQAIRDVENAVTIDQVNLALQNGKLAIDDEYSLEHMGDNPTKCPFLNFCVKVLKFVFFWVD